MSPNVSTSRRKETIASKQKQTHSQAMAVMNAAASKVRQEIEDKCDYVGDKFADEARAIHYGEKMERPIYGQATPSEATGLIEEGVDIAPLPDILRPKPSKKIN